MLAPDGHILTINGGSSTIKFALFAPGDPMKRVQSGQIECPNGPDAEAAEQVIAQAPLASVAAIGHRVVHGGSRFVQPCRITPEVLAELGRLVQIDPDHLPGEIALIEAMIKSAPGVPQAACFDTAFFADMPRVAKLLPIPRRYEKIGLRRYGFHGLSYTYLMRELRRLDAPAAEGKVILAHLGNGASLAAVSGGKCVDTTMGFTPTGGLVMGTRSGDLDPGAMVYLARSEKLSAGGLGDLVNKQSGMLGVSETSADMRKLVELRTTDVRAAEAVELFCYAARKQIGAMAAALGGVGTLVFSGGIGEHSALARAQICAGLEFLGVRMDESRNAAHSPVISADSAACAVRVIATDEESVLAAEARRMLLG